jgi:hypothetical protein
MSPARMPNKIIKALGSGREIDLQNLGVPTVLIFHYRDTSETARSINNTIREEYTAEDVLVASVLDLHSIPKLARGATKAMINREYQKAVDDLKPDQKPEDYVILLPDWNGQMTKAFGFKDTNSKVGLVFLDASGYILETYHGDNPVTDVLTLLKKHLSV